MLVFYVGLKVFHVSFACCFGFQVGIAEIKIAVERTGGLVVLAESFGHSVFKDSLKRVFQLGDYELGLSSKYVSWVIPKWKIALVHFQISL